MKNPKTKIDIIPFSLTHKESIKTLNLEWLQKFFKVEPKDELVLSNPVEEIINKGGKIYYAQHLDEIVGTVSLLKIDTTTFELSKMAVTEKVQGLGIGRQLIEFCIEEAQKHGIQKLILYSNRQLKSALHLYESFGFEEIPVESGVYERADIKMELLLSQ
ncbi:GNAT family N-acetyltransferase [Flavobacterium sp. 9R]|uniref:GNAT family N-acetyltransferase n=1 Tax=Flavobacterium sp. 9R TaxID=2653143 RepID=UPI0012F2AB90|nr:GNAT family N-acetyltransferase [Flavobacterium sp. 9R]VXB88995.1 GNAT family N-acetyltransferase [Flavobacterium sp. 9R]